MTSVFCLVTIAFKSGNSKLSSLKISIGSGTYVIFLTKWLFKIYSVIRYSLLSKTRHNLHPSIFKQLLYPSIHKKERYLIHIVLISIFCWMKPSSEPLPSPSKTLINQQISVCPLATTLTLERKGDINNGKTIKSSLWRVYSGNSINKSRGWCSFMILTKTIKKLYSSK